MMNGKLMLNLSQHRGEKDVITMFNTHQAQVPNDSSGPHCPCMEDVCAMEETASGVQHLALDSCQCGINHQHGK